MIVAIGMDPGPTPGLVKLTYSDGKLIGVNVVQCSANSALDVLEMWLHGLPRGSACERYFGAEQYVDRERGRSGAAGQRTKDLVGSALTLAVAGSAYGVQRKAVTVKAWATDARLERLGLIAATKGMTHARDAARHALYTAVKDGKCPDPYSRRTASDG